MMKLHLIVGLLTCTSLSCLDLKAQSDTLFTRFEVQSFNGQAGISFTIRGGILCSGVRIERSIDGLVFETVYEFPGVCGNPGSDESYQWFDENPPANQLLYYRLELGSLGLFSESRTVLIRKLSDGDLLIYPTPCSECTVEFYNPLSRVFQYRIYNSNGKLIVNGQSNGDRINLQLSSQATGAYILELQTENQTPSFKPFLIQNNR